MDIKEALANIKLSKNFTALEFANKQDGCAIKVPDIKLFECLQKVRDKVGSMTITSGYRTEKFNASINGSDNSNHLTGHALDVVAEGLKKLSQQQILDLFVTAGFTNVGIYYKGKSLAWVHADISPRWPEKNGWKNYKTASYKIYSV